MRTMTAGGKDCLANTAKRGGGETKRRTLFVDGEDDSAAEDQPRQSRRCASPEAEDALFAKDAGGAVERVAVLCARLEGLHAGLDDAVKDVL